MSIVFSTSVIFVSDIEKSKQFYVDLFELKIEHDFGANIIFQNGVSIWKIGEGHEIKKIESRPKNESSFELYFETDDIKSFMEKLSQFEVELFHPLKTESWGQQCIRFFDPDHHLIEVGESLETFVFRIYKETGSVKTTAKQTGVQEALIEKIVY